MGAAREHSFGEVPESAKQTAANMDQKIYMIESYYEDYYEEVSLDPDQKATWMEEIQQGLAEIEMDLNVLNQMSDQLPPPAQKALKNMTREFPDLQVAILSGDPSEAFSDLKSYSESLLLHLDAKT